MLLGGYIRTQFGAAQNNFQLFSAAIAPWARALAASAWASYWSSASSAPWARAFVVGASYWSSALALASSSSAWLAVVGGAQAFGHGSCAGEAFAQGFGGVRSSALGLGSVGRRLKSFQRESEKTKTG